MALHIHGEKKKKEEKSHPIPKAQTLTLFLLIESAAPSSEWMQADKASCDNP